MEEKQLKISEMLAKIEASPMQTMLRSIQARHELLEPPSLRLAREIQERISTISPMSVVSKQFSDQMSIRLPNLTASLEMQKANLKLAGLNKSFAHIAEWNERITLLSAGIKWATFVTSKITESKILEALDKLDLSSEDLLLYQKEDIVIEDYRLDAIPFGQSEKKIILLHEVNRLQLTMEEVYRDNSKLYTLKPRDFEEMIGELLKHKNFQVELTKQTRDGGYDLIAIQNLAGFPLRFIVECKRFAQNRPVGVEIIRAFSNVIHTNNANKGILFTTSYFSPDARQHAQTHMPYQLDFRDRGDILEWIKSYLQPTGY